MSAPIATGRRHDGSDGLECRWERTFSAPIDDVWAAVTRSDRLARYLGSWTGDPTAGHVRFQMLFEGDDIPAERFDIDECVPPHRLRVTAASPDAPDSGAWRFGVDLTEEQPGVTVLVFTMRITDPAAAEAIGPGWDYYLDRLVVAERGEDPGALDFHDYYPALAEHYRAEFGG